MRTCGLVVGVIFMLCTRALMPPPCRCYDTLRHADEPCRRQLLKFSVKEGWGPLCEFLGVPVPDVPFPKVNSTEQINAMHKRSVCLEEACHQKQHDYFPI